jgi:hypothetical protein
MMFSPIPSRLTKNKKSNSSDITEYSKQTISMKNRFTDTVISPDFLGSFQENSSHTTIVNLFCVTFW